MATYPHLGACTLELPDKWVDAWKFEKALVTCGDALGASYNTIVIKVPSGCKLMIDVIIRLLSFCNQAVACTKRVRLEFGTDAMFSIFGELIKNVFDHSQTSLDAYAALQTYARNIGITGFALDHLSEDNVTDIIRRDARPFDGFGNDDSPQLPRRDVLEAAPEITDCCARSGQDHNILQDKFLQKSRSSNAALVEALGSFDGTPHGGVRVRGFRFFRAGLRRASVRS